MGEVNAHDPRMYMEICARRLSSASAAWGRAGVTSMIICLHPAFEECFL